MRHEMGRRLLGDTTRNGAPFRASQETDAGIFLAEEGGEVKNVADGIYVGMSAAAARAAQLESISDNLANVETPGFKAGRPSFQSFLPGRGTTDKVFTAAVATG